MYGIRNKEVANIYSNPDSTLGEIQAIRPSAQRAEAMIDLHNIFQEFLYWAKMERQFSQFTAASASDGPVDCALRKLSFIIDAAEEFLTYQLHEELDSSELVSPLDKGRLAMLSLQGSDANGDDEVQDGIDEVQKMWRNVKARKYGSGGGGIGRVKFCTNKKRNGRARGRGTGSSAGNKNLIRFWDVRETDFELWRA